MADWMTDLLYIAAALLLVLLNAFFVAAEFALVKVRPSRLEQMVKDGRPRARTALWLASRMDATLSACQLGITMASLGLGWLGEPAFAHLVGPVLRAVGISSPTVLHTVAFIIAFVLITSLHLVIGEQAPKIFSIRRPESTLLRVAGPLKVLYVLMYPLLSGLKAATEVLLRRVGVTGTGEHEPPASQEEIRTILSRAHAHGELTRSEHRLLHAVFEFDDMITRRVMVPRADVVFFDVESPIADCIELARRTKHTRYPVCDGSLDKVLGVAHIKDLLGVSGEKPYDLRTIVRAPRQIPETMPISRLLRHFQATHELMALVVDEHGTVAGVVTLENVLEEIVGPVEDEFDTEPPPFVEEGTGSLIVLGGTSIGTVNRKLGLELETDEADTLSGLLTARQGRILEVGDRIALPGAEAEVLDLAGTRARRVRVRVETPPEDPATPAR